MIDTAYKLAVQVDSEQNKERWPTGKGTHDGIIAMNFCNMFEEFIARFHSFIADFT